MLCRRFRIFGSCLLLGFVSLACSARESAVGLPDCSRYPKNVALVAMKNAGILWPSQLIESDTEVRLLSRHHVGFDEEWQIDLYRQVYRFGFLEKSGESHTVITVNDISIEECSMSSVEVYVVATELGESVLYRGSEVSP